MHSAEVTFPGMYAVYSLYPFAEDTKRNSYAKLAWHLGFYPMQTVSRFPDQTLQNPVFVPHAVYHTT